MHFKFWKPEELKLVGILRDEEVAARTGHTVNAVTLRRNAMGLPMPHARIYRWKSEHDKLLGALPDREVAARIGCRLTSVEQRRRRLGIRSINTRKV
jgi:hypothetical protein